MNKMELGSFLKMKTLSCILGCTFRFAVGKLASCQKTEFKNWKTSVSPSTTETLSNHQKKDAKWVENYNRLKVFKEQHGTTEVSADVDRYLSIWVHAQQRNWREGKLQTWKKQLLEQLEVDPHFERKRVKETSREEEGGSITEEDEHQLVSGVGKVVEEVLQNGTLSQSEQPVEGSDGSVLQPLILALLENQGANNV
jgi:hypothetical protein